MFPLIRLLPMPNAGQLARSLERIEAAFDARPVALDLARPRPTPKPRGVAANQELARLHDPAGGFAAYASFIQPHGTITPTLQWTDDPILLAQEVEALADLGRGLVVRLRRTAGWNAAQLTHLRTINLNGVPVLVVLDHEQIGHTTDLTMAALALQNIALAARDALAGANLTFAMAASSFPCEFASIDPRTAVLPIKERSLHVLVNGSAPLKSAGISIIYGDHVSVYCDDRPEAFRGAPRVDFAGPASWTYHRRHEGFVAAAQAVAAEKVFDPALVCWGAQEIRRAASGDDKGLGSAGAWTTVRINTHMHQQAHYDDGSAAGAIEEAWTD